VKRILFGFLSAPRMGVGAVLVTFIFSFFFFFSFFAPPHFLFSMGFIFVLIFCLHGDPADSSTPDGGREGIFLNFYFLSFFFFLLFAPPHFFYLLLGFIFFCCCLIWHLLFGVC
jgi:hypothetical protein